MEEHKQLRGFVEKMLEEVNEDTWQSFAEKLQVRRVAKGQLVLKPGLVCRHVSFVNKGLLRSYYLVDGKEIVTAFFPENCYFSDYESFLSRKPAVMYSEALEDSEIVDICYEDLQALYDSNRQVERVGRMVAEDLFVHLSNKISSFLLDTPEQRYLRFMEEWAHVAQRVPQYMIASYLGFTPEALSRIRARISRKTREGVIDLNQ